MNDIQYNKELISWEKFEKKYFHKDNLTSCLFYVRITKKDAIHILNNYSNGPNRPANNKNKLKIRKAFDNGTWNDNVANCMAFSKKVIFGVDYGARQVSDGNHRIEGLAATSNEDAYMDVAVFLDKSPAYEQDCGMTRNRTMQVQVAGIIKEDTFTKWMQNIFSVFIRVKHIDELKFYTAIMEDYYDKIKDFEQVVYINGKSQKNQLLRFSASAAAFLNLYLFDSISIEDVKIINNFFQNPNDELYSDVKFTPLKALNTTLSSIKAGVSSTNNSNKPRFNVTMQAIQDYKKGIIRSEMYSLETENMNIEWFRMFDFISSEKE